MVDGKSNSVGKYKKIMMNNLSCMFDINRQGGARSPSFCAKAMRFWNWCIGNQITFSAAYLPRHTKHQRRCSQQVASRELKIPMSSIHFCETSTTTVPNACATVASVGTDVNGMAVKDACQTLLKRLEPIISKNPEGTWNDWVKEAFEQSINLSATGYFRGYDADMDWEKGEGHPFTYFVFGAACSEVEIDCLTGDHKNIQTDIVMDIGCSINPAVDIGQIEGAFVQGIGLYTMEELKYSPEGVLYTRGPDQYKIPAVCDIPEQFSISLLSSSKNPYAIYSSKGMGEAGLFLGCSVFFALWDAVAAMRKERELTGAFTLNSPLTPERIRMACADNFTEMSTKDEPESFVPWDISI